MEEDKNGDPKLESDTTQLGRIPFTSNPDDLLVPIPAKSLPSKPLSEVEEFQNATMRVLASPHTAALTSSLFIGMITLPFGSKMEPRKALGAEIYYVLQGKGRLLQIITSGTTEDECVEYEHLTKVNPGDTFLVNPNR